MRIWGIAIGVVLVVGILAGIVGSGGCSSGSGGPPGPEEVAREYIESGNVDQLDRFLSDAMFGIPGVLEITQVETWLVSETADTAIVEAECKIGIEGEAVRGSEVEMQLELEKQEGEWEVTEVEIL